MSSEGFIHRSYLLLYTHNIVEHFMKNDHLHNIDVLSKPNGHSNCNLSNPKSAKCETSCTGLFDCKVQKSMKNNSIVYNWQSPFSVLFLVSTFCFVLGYIHLSLTLNFYYKWQTQLLVWCLKLLYLFLEGIYFLIPPSPNNFLKYFNI